MQVDVYTVYSIKECIVLELCTLRPLGVPMISSMEKLLKVGHLTMMQKQKNNRQNLQSYIACDS